MRDEATRFLNSLTGADQEALDAISASTMFWHTSYQRKGLDLYDMGSWIIDDIAFPIELNKLIKALQRDGNPASTVGLQVWLHSARALTYPDQRIYGRNIWNELTKATEEAEELAEELCEAVSYDLMEHDRKRVPVGLEKLDR